MKPNPCMKADGQFHDLSYICECGFDSDDEVEYANHRRDQHLATSLVFPDQVAYDIWLEGAA